MSLARGRSRKPIGDPAKTRTYAWLDLATRLISSMSLVALGIAGWRLQNQADRSREALESSRAAIEERERQQRRYLPMLRSLTELELELNRLSTELREHSAAKARSRDVGVRRAARRLRDVATTIFIIGNDPVVAVSTSDIVRYDTFTNKQKKLPLRGSTIMLAEILIMQSAPGAYRDSLNGDLNVKEARLEVGDSYMNISPQSVEAWAALLGGEKLVATRLRDINALALANALRAGVADVIQRTLLENPSLGDRYVEIRSQLVTAGDMRR